MLFNTENLYPTHIYVTSPATGQLPEVGVDHIPLKKWSGERERERERGPEANIGPYCGNLKLILGRAVHNILI